MTSKLSKRGLDKAHRFVSSHGRGVDAALLDYVLFDGDAHKVVSEVARFQNADGGFGHGLEPDLRTPASTAIATTVGLQFLREVGSPSRDPVVSGAIRYLVDSLDQEALVWPIITSEVEMAAHAPWWSFSDRLSESWNGFRFNPSAEAFGYLFEHREIVPQGVLDRATRGLLARLEEEGVLTSYYEVQCCVRLHRSPGLPASLKKALTEILEVSLPKLDPEDEHTNYLELSPWPDDFVYPLIRDHFAGAVAQRIEDQDERGCWNPFWDWSEVDADEWAKAEVEWQGVLTRSTLITLHHHGLIADR